MTGGAGFIGSHVVDALLREGAAVSVVDDLSTGEKARVAPDAELFELDIVDGEALAALVRDLAPDAVYHLAAQSSVTVSVEDPGRDCATNVVGTLNVLRAAGAVSAPVVFTSTGGALYGDGAPRPTPESQIPAPLSPYGASKWAGEAYVNTWSLSSGIPHAVLRLGNVYGARQSPHGEAGVVAIFTGKLYEGVSPVLYGHGRPTRDYIYIDDVVAAVLAASGTRGTFNIATGVETSVADIWTGLCAAAGVDAEAQLAELRPGELQHSCLDASRARAELGWRARTAIGEGLARSYEALTAELAAAR